VLFLEKKPILSLSIGSKNPFLHIAIGLGVGILLVAESIVLQKMKGANFNVHLDQLIIPFFVS
jgi:hypothetical protein